MRSSPAAATMPAAPDSEKADEGRKKVAGDEAGVCHDKEGCGDHHHHGDQRRAEIQGDL